MNKILLANAEILLAARNLELFDYLDLMLIARGLMRLTFTEQCRKDSELDWQLASTLFGLTIASNKFDKLNSES